MLSPNLLPMFPLFPNKSWKNRDSKTYSRIMFYSDIVELTQVIKQSFGDSLEKSFLWDLSNFPDNIYLLDAVLWIFFLYFLTGSF